MIRHVATLVDDISTLLETLGANIKHILRVIPLYFSSRERAGEMFSQLLCQSQVNSSFQGIILQNFSSITYTSKQPQAAREALQQRDTTAGR